MSKYTKGPWTLPKFGGWEKELEIPEPQVWVDYDDVDREEAEANARLIVAAPDLLAALKALWSDIVEYNLINHMPNANNNHAMLQAVAAIAKAEETAA